MSEKDDLPRFPDILPSSIRQSLFHRIEPSDIQTEADLDALIQLMYDFPERDFYYFREKGGGHGSLLDGAVSDGTLLAEETQFFWYRHPKNPRDYVRIEVRDGRYKWEWEKEVVEKTPMLMRTKLRLSERKRRELDIQEKVRTDLRLKRIIPDTRRVLIVHGHDETNVGQLSAMLRETYNLEPVVLRLRPTQGRTIIEKFEQEAGTCAFAFVVMTPDDQVRVPRPTRRTRPSKNFDLPAAGQIADSEAYAQARPNVLFELGWAYGRLGRDRVCVLFRRGTSIHSDIEGIERIEFTESITEAVEGIERELTAAGLLRKETP